MSSFQDRINTQEENGKLTYRLEMKIHATPQAVWEKVANVDEIRKWDSMIMEIEGAICEGGRVNLRSSISPNQKFKLKISDVVSQRKMAWSSGMAPLFKGVRSYRLSKEGEHTVLLIEEVFTGWLLPMMKNKLPACDALFGSYARDLRKALSDDNMGIN